MTIRHAYFEGQKPVLKKERNAENDYPQRVQQQPVVLPSAVAESRCDPQCQEMLDSVVANNMYEFLDDTGYRYGFVQFVKANYFLCPNHYVTTLRLALEEGRIGRDHVMSLKSLSTDEVITVTLDQLFNSQKCTSLRSKDLTLVKVDKSVCKKDILKYFSNSTDFVQPRSYDVRFETYDNGKSRSYFGKADKLPVGLQVRVPNSNITYVVNGVWRYNVDTTRGMCGSFLCI